MIPLILRLKRSIHKEIAKAQDLVIEELYKVFDKAILHGGTSIWRCYNGNRFSEDIDVYLPRDVKRINLFFHRLEKSGFKTIKKKIGTNSLYSAMQLGPAVIRFEAIFKKTHGSLKEYENAESNFITVYTLTPEELIAEKVAAYLKRRKARDLYDVFFLLRYVKDQGEIDDKLKRLINDFKPPVDERDLKTIIFEGLVPSAEEMLKYIARKV